MIFVNLMIVAMRIYAIHPLEWCCMSTFEARRFTKRKLRVMIVVNLLIVAMRIYVIHLVEWCCMLTFEARRFRKRKMRVMIVVNLMIHAHIRNSPCRMVLHVAFQHLAFQYFALTHLECFSTSQRSQMTRVREVRRRCPRWRATGR